jgi:rhodanese-related sulfurtransferase
LVRILRQLLPAGFLLAALGVGCSPQEKTASDGAEFEELDPTAASQLIEDHRGDAAFVILDVRTPGEFREERIDGAVNIDFHSPNFRDQIAALDRDATYFVYCRTGNRSGKILPLLRELGFHDVHHLRRGITSWKSAGGSTVRG